MDLIAYALTDEYAGTTKQGKEDVPTFQGGVLWVDGDFDVRDQLDAGDGTIVVRDRDTALISVLDTYPALERVDVPDEPKAIVSPYTRLPDDTLRDSASLRGIAGAATKGRRALVNALDTDDRRQEKRTAAISAGEPVLPDDDTDEGDADGDATTTTTTGD